MHTRTKLVTFRLSEEEYEHLRNASTARGARSVSEFVRSSVGWLIENGDRHVWEIVMSPGHGAFSPATRSLRLEKSRASREETPSQHNLRLPRAEMPGDALLALEGLSNKVEALSALVWSRLADAREAG